MNKRMRTVILSMVTVCLCLTLVVGASFALFSDEVMVNNHLQAGTLEVGLLRTKVEKSTLQADGTLAVTTDEKEVDLKTDASKLFEMGTVVPGCYSEATIKVSNEGSVAFDYGVRVLWDGTEANAQQLALANQITITISTISGEQKGQFALANASDVNVNLGSIAAKADAQQFVVRAEFVDDNATNNNAQDATIDFDIQVYATQKTAN